MNPFYLICLIWITLCASVLAKDSPADAVRKRFAEETFAAGKLQPVPQAKLEIILEKSTWEIGEPIWAKLKVSSTDKEFTIDQGGDYRPCGYPRRCKVVATDPDGKIMPDHGFDMQMGGIGGSETITQSEPCTFEFPILDTVNFAVPGEYQIYVSHDLGWKITNTHPVVSTKIKLIEPTTESAAKRVKDLLSKINNTGRDSQSRVIDIEDQRSSHRAKMDIKWLRHPSYLPELKTAAKNGEAFAVEGIGGISSTKALQVLIELTHSEHSDIAIESARIIEMIGPDSHDLDFEYWDPSLHQAAIIAAEKLLNQTGNIEKLIAGSGIINRHGTPREMEIILKALESSFNNDRVSEHLARTIGTLIDRGYRTSDWSSNAHMTAGFIQANKAWRFQALKKARETHIIKKKVINSINLPSIPMPTGTKWKQSILAISDTSPILIRRLAIAAIPPTESGFEDLLITTLADQDENVALSACDKMRTTRNKKFIPYLERIFEYNSNPKVIKAARYAATELTAN